VGNAPLCENYPQLFSIKTLKDAVVGDLWEEIDGLNNWLFAWRRNLFEWENALLLIGWLEEIGGGGHVMVEARRGRCY